MSALAAALRRERTIVGAALTALTTLAWLYVWQGAGMGMTALAMTKLALFPHLTAEPMPDMVMPAISWLTVVAMWWVMMIAMMLPSATPFILLYERIVRHAERQARASNVYIQVALLAIGYLIAWLVFSSLAAALQYVLRRAGLISQMMLWSHSAWLSATVLAFAGVYQLTPLKRACLKRCRGPAEFIAKHMRQGRYGAFVMGLEHGAWCVGCCWMLMALLFVGGVMNLVWIALIAALVLIEKIAAHGVLAGRLTGGLLLIWSIATLLA